MASAVARPAHRRQGSDVTLGPLPALGAATSTVTLDGRLLEVHDVQQRGRLQKDDDGRLAKAQSSKGAVARPPPLARAPPDKAPMTPPRVSGVSLAPLPNLEHHNGGGNFSGSDKSPGASASAKHLQRRPSLTTHLPLGGKAPPQPASVAANGCGGGGAAAAGGANGCGAGHSSGHGQLFAEGRSIVRNVTLDPWIVAYMDINGTGETDECDSVCVTPPPRLNMQSLARADTHGGAFGPLTPCPLSPSILTVCGQPGHDDQFALFNSSSGDLLDMRTCQSPKLPPV